MMPIHNLKIESYKLFQAFPLKYSWLFFSIIIAYLPKFILFAFIKLFIDLFSIYKYFVSSILFAEFRSCFIHSFKGFSK